MRNSRDYFNEPITSDYIPEPRKPGKFSTIAGVVIGVFLLGCLISIFFSCKKKNDVGPRTPISLRISTSDYVYVSYTDSNLNMQTYQGNDFVYPDMETAALFKSGTIKITSNAYPTIMHIYELTPDGNTPYLKDVNATVTNNADGTTTLSYTIP